MLDLTTLKFSVHTQELDEALTKVDRLASAFGKLTPAVTKAEKESVSLAKAQAEAAKAAAQAEKAELALAQAKEKTAKASKKKSDSDKEATEITKSNITALEKQRQILEFMTQGFSRGQSTILTMAKAAGAAASELKEIGDLVQSQRKLVGGDPFDKSASGLFALTGRLNEARIAADLYNQGAELTKAQTRELARDHERLVEKLKAEGKTLVDTDAAWQSHKAQYIAAANAINQLDRAEQSRLVASNNSAKATDWVTRELNRAEAALNGLNNELHVSNSNRLLKFQEQLKLAGISGSEAANMLKKYEETITATQKQQSVKRIKDREEELKYLARATSVQIGDIAISLAGGQNPITVFMQQG